MVHLREVTSTSRHPSQLVILGSHRKAFSVGGVSVSVSVSFPLRLERADRPSCFLFPSVARPPPLFLGGDRETKEKTRGLLFRSWRGEERRQEESLRRLVLLHGEEEEEEKTSRSLPLIFLSSSSSLPPLSVPGGGGGGREEERASLFLSLSLFSQQRPRI